MGFTSIWVNSFLVETKNLSDLTVQPIAVLPVAESRVWRFSEV